MLKAGDKAPDFSLPDADGNNHSLSDYKGKWILLYFYPKDFTIGCTTEACSFRDNFEGLKERLDVVGVSADSTDSHKKFSEKHKLPFTLLSDSDRNMIKKYGATGFMFTKRVTFLIDPDGVIRKVYNKVDPNTHVSQILSDLRKLQEK